MTGAHTEPGIEGGKGALLPVPQTAREGRPSSQRGAAQGLRARHPGERHRHACPPRRRGLVLPSGIELSLGSVSGPAGPPGTDQWVCHGDSSPLQGRPG